MPHPAFSPVPDYNKPSTIQEQGSNEAAYRQLLVQGMLAVLLPTEDLRNPCLRSLVGDILGEMILGNGIGGKACEGWMIWDGITKMVENAKVKTDTKATKEEIKVETRSRLEKFGLLSEKERARKNKIDEGIRGRAKSGHGSMIKQSIWRTLQFCYVTFTTIRFIVVGLMAASSSSSRGQPPLQLKSVRGDVQAPMKEGFEAPGTGAWTVTGGAAAGKRPILSYGCFGLVSQLLDLPSRMPWFSGTLSLIQHQLVEGVAGAGIGAADGILDR